MKLLSIRDVIHIYRIPKRKIEIPVLNGVTTNFKAGQIHFILGPSGSGKTTLLKIIAGILKPTSGKVVDERNNSISSGNIAFLHQNPILNTFPNLTVRDNIIIQMSALRQDLDFENILFLFNTLELNINLERKVSNYSMGQIQRIGIVLALIRPVDVLVLDEPTSHLDMENAMNLISILQNIAQKQNKIIIISTHSQELASNYPFQVLVDGRLVNLTLEEAIEEYLVHKRYFQSTENPNVSGQIEFTASCINGKLKLPPFLVALGDWVRYLSISFTNEGFILEHDKAVEAKLEIPLPKDYDQKEIDCIMDLDKKLIIGRWKNP